MQTCLLLGGLSDWEKLMNFPRRQPDVWGLESTPTFTKQQLPSGNVSCPERGSDLIILPSLGYLENFLIPRFPPFFPTVPRGCLVGGPFGFLAGGLQGRQAEVVLSPLPRSACIQQGAGEGWRCAGSLGGPGVNPPPLCPQSSGKWRERFSTALYGSWAR